MDKVPYNHDNGNHEVFNMVMSGKMFFSTNFTNMNPSSTLDTAHQQKVHMRGSHPLVPIKPFTHQAEQGLVN